MLNRSGDETGTTGPFVAAPRVADDRIARRSSTSCAAVRHCPIIILFLLITIIVVSSTGVSCCSNEDVDGTDRRRPSFNDEYLSLEDVDVSASHRLDAGLLSRAIVYGLEKSLLATAVDGPRTNLAQI